MNPNFTLDEFIGDDSSRLALTSIQSVLDYPGETFNPLFIFGSSGLGKTHLLQAMCRELMNRRPTNKIRYLTSDEFANEFAASVQSHDLEAFRKEYRHADVLLIDDVQQLAGMDRVQVELCMTLDAITNSGRQIILTSDVHPREITSFKSKLSTRFLSGLVCRLDSPSFEARCRIVKRKLENRDVVTTDEVIKYIAEHIKSNVRELEGAVLKVIAMASVNDAAVTMDVAVKAIRDILPTRSGPVTLDEILQAVEKFFGVPADEIRSKRRETRVLIPRQVGMYLAKELTDCSYQTIGKFFGRRNHATALHARRKTVERMNKSPKLAEEVKTVLNTIRGGRPIE